MPTHNRVNLRVLSMSQLAELTGRDRRTIRRLLSSLTPAQVDGRTLYYATVAALDAIYGGPGLDLTRERARLSRAQAVHQESKNKEREGEVIPAADAEHVIVTLLSGVRTLLLAIPTTTAEELAESSVPKECHRIVETAITEALQAIADSSVVVESVTAHSARSRARRPERGRRRSATRPRS